MEARQITVEELLKAIKKPEGHAEVLHELMDKSPELLIGSLQDLSQISYTPSFAQYVGKAWENHHRYWGSWVPSEMAIRMMNAGHYQWWISDKWKRGRGSDVPLNFVGLILADKFPRGSSSMMADNFCGHIASKEEAVDAMMIAGTTSDLTEPIARAFQKMPEEWWPEVSRACKVPDALKVAVKYKSPAQRRQIFSYISRKNDDFLYKCLPPSIYGNARKAGEQKHCGVLFNPNLPTQKKLDVLDEMDTKEVEGQSLSLWTYRHHNSYQRYPNMPQYIVCPRVCVIDLDDAHISPRAHESILVLMEAFRKLKLKNAISFKEYALTDLPGADKAAEWINTGRIK